MTNGFDEILALRGNDAPPADNVRITGADPVFSTRFKIGEASANILAGIGLAVSDIHEMKTGRRQSVDVDVRRAAAACRSSKYQSVLGADGTWSKGVADTPVMKHLRQLTRPWLCKDGRWAMVHFNMTHMHDRIMNILGCESEAESIAAAISSKWDAQDLEDAISEAKACCTVVRSNAEWLAHPHGAMLANQPLIEIEKIGDTDPIPFAAGERPLDGLRVLDLTRILAGPIAARTLAEHGADVLLVAAEHLPQVPEHVMDTSHGKRSLFLDFNKSDELAAMKKLIAGADVFSQGYRNGVMDRFGLGAADLAEMRPGIVYVSINCYGFGGPFSGRGGWEQLAQSATGICKEHGGDKPKLLPATACDYTTGYLGAYGVLLALLRRAREGGSYHVRVSLCRSGMYLHDLGRVDFPRPDMDLEPEELQALMKVTETSFGTVRHLAPVLQLSETPPYWDKPTPVRGSARAEWL